MRLDLDLKQSIINLDLILIVTGIASDLNWARNSFWIAHPWYNQNIPVQALRLPEYAERVKSERQNAKVKIYKAIGQAVR